jgi:hypothetical protein
MAKTITLTKTTAKNQVTRLETAKSLNTSSIVAPATNEIANKISTADIREAATALETSKIQARLGKGNGLTDKPGSGGSTGGLVKEITTPGFDKGKAGKGNVSEGEGILGLSDSEKELWSDIAADYAMTGGVIAAIPTPVTQGAGLGTLILAAGAHFLSKYGEPVPDEITGSNPGVTITGKGVGFDPITGQGPTKNEKLGQFTGDETKASGVILTQEEARNFQTAISQAQGNFLKNPNPMGDSSETTVIDERSMQRVDLILAGGGAAGPTGNNFQQFAVAQNMQFTIATDALFA